MTDTCGCTKRDGSEEPCELPAGWGTDTPGEGPCKYHGGAAENQGAPEGNDNATDHGAFKEHFRSDLTPEEQNAIDSLVAHLTDINDERTVAAECAAEALMKYKRSADSRFLREARQWFSEFNLIPNSDEISLQGQFNHDHSGDATLEVAWGTVEDAVQEDSDSDPDDE
jgi:hypothetical protein